MAVTGKLASRRPSRTGAEHVQRRFCRDMTHLSASAVAHDITASCTANGCAQTRRHAKLRTADSMASSASLAETNLPATWPEALFLVPRANGLADFPHSFDSCLSRKACERAAATASASECGKHANGLVPNHDRRASEDAVFALRELTRRVTRKK